MNFDGKNFLKRYLKVIITAVIAAAVLAGTGIYTLNKKAEVEARKASYTLTDFDYTITSPSAEQVEKFKQSPAVAGIFACYNFSVNLSKEGGSGEKMDILMSENLAGYNISLFSEKTCISGGVDEKGIMLDETAANMLGVSVGDNVTMRLAGEAYRLKVAGIYLASTYLGYESGLGLAVFTPEMSGQCKKTFKKTTQYSLGFVKAADSAALESLLTGYKPYGQFPLQEDYIADRKAKEEPIPGYEEEWEQQLVADYQAKKAEFEKQNYPYAVRAKADVMADVLERVASTQSSIKTLSISVAVATVAVYTILGVIYVFTNKRDDELNRSYGVTKGRLLSGYVLSSFVSAAAVCLVVGAILAIYASTTAFFGALMPLIALFALPVLLSAALISAAALIYLNILYR